MTQRAAGLLAHVTSLPGRYGIGDLGPHVERWLEGLAAAGQSAWQMLPLGPTGDGHSPYSTLSSAAGNPLLVSPERLAERGWLTADDLGAPWPADAHVDFAQVGRWRRDRLQSAWARFRQVAGSDDRRRLEAFRDGAHGRRLSEWCRFAALRERFGGAWWIEWPEAWRTRAAVGLDPADTDLAEAIDFQAFVQFAFHEQWSAIRRAARRHGIDLIGDLPFYPGHDSADVWAAQDQFRLDDAGRSTAVAGVPPDYFSETGQLWGNPLYDWKRVRQTGYRWWVGRLDAALAWTDLVRLDHFRGFTGFWEVPADAATAAAGRWVPGPGRPLFDAVEASLGGLPFLAEDLGDVTPDVDALRRELRLPGMRIFQFAFGADGDPTPHLRDGTCAVAYTGTHDNDTLRGWYASLEPAGRDEVRARLGCDEATVVEAAIEHVLGDPADLAIVPLQDLLGLDGAARMNVPGVAEGNWSWRATADPWTDERVTWLAERTRRAGRVPDRSRSS